MDTLTLARSFASLLLDSAAKGTALLLLACLAAWLCRRSSAALRHSIWCLTMGGLLLLPVAAWALPAWQIPILPPEPVAAPTPVAEVVRLSTPVAEPIPPSVTPPRKEPAPQLTAENALMPSVQKTIGPLVLTPPVIEPTPAPAIIEPPAPPLTTIEWTALLVSALWSLGVSLFGVLLLVGLWRTVKLRRTSFTVTNGEWPDMLIELRQRLGLSRSVELREHAQSVVPLTWGIWRPVVLLPKLARAWDEPMRRAVLLHELAHVQRGDVACQVLGRLTCVLYWFHPLAWFALRQLRQEREQACDDAVVQSGEKASDYAEQLLQVARLCCAPRGLSLGVAMAEGSSIERRILSLFDSARGHGPVTRRVAITSILIGTAILVGLAPIEPTASQAEPVEIEIAPSKNQKSEVTNQTVSDESTASAADVLETEEPLQAAQSAVTARVYAALKTQGSLHFDQAPLKKILEHIADTHGIGVSLDSEGLEGAGATEETPVTIQVDGSTLSSALNQVLAPLKLGYIVENEVLMITSSERLSKTAPENLRGQVLDAQQQPVEGALLVFPCFLKREAGSVPQIFRTYSGRDGEFLIKLPRKTIDIASFHNHAPIWCQKDGHGLGAAHVAPALGSEPLTVQLPALDPVEFVVQSDAGQPLAGVRMEVDNTKIPAWDGAMEDQQGSLGKVPEELRPFVTKVSDADGKVILDTIPRDRHYDLKMTSEQYGVQHFLDPRKYLKLLPVASVSGKLSNSQAGVKLAFNIPHEYFGSYIKASAEATTDEQGNFSIAKFPIGPVTITSDQLRGPMFLEQIPREVKPDGNQFDLKVISGVKITGRVMLKKPSRGVRKAVVGFSSEVGQPVETDEDGKYVAYSLPQPDVATYFAGSSGEAFPLLGAGSIASYARIKIPDGATEVQAPDIVLEEGMFLSGQLVDEKKQPIGGVYVVPFPSSTPFTIRTDEQGRFGTMVSPDRRPGGWLVGWNDAPDPSILSEQFGDNAPVWAKTISKEPLILQIKRSTQPERFISYDQLDMDLKIPPEQVIWGDAVDGLQPGFWLRSTGEPLNQRVPMNSLVTYRVLLRNVGKEDRDVVVMLRPDAPSLISSDRLVDALGSGKLPADCQSKISQGIYKGEHSRVVTIPRGESLMLYGNPVSAQSGLFIGQGNSEKYPVLAEIAQPGKNWIVHPLVVQGISASERQQMEEALKADRSRSTLNITMLDSRGQPRKETSKDATPLTKPITLYAKIELDVGTLAAAIPAPPEKNANAITEEQAEHPLPLDQIVWCETVDGVQAGCLLTIPSALGPFAELNSQLVYAVFVRNTTEKPVVFHARMLAYDGLEVPYLIPSDKLPATYSDGLPSPFKARGATRNAKEPGSAHQIELAPGEMAIVPGILTIPDLILEVGDYLSDMDAEEKAEAREYMPKITTVAFGKNWIVQPVTIRVIPSTEKPLERSPLGEVPLAVFTREGELRKAPLTPVPGMTGGRTVYAKSEVEIVSLASPDELNAEAVTWGDIDKHMQCGVRLPNPQRTFQVGDTLEVEILWRNSSVDKEAFATPRPGQFDLTPIIRNAEGGELTIDFGERSQLPSETAIMHPGSVLSLGVTKIRLVAPGTPSPTSNTEPGHITLEPGTYTLIGTGGAGSEEVGNPHSEKIEFTVTAE